MAVRVGSEDVIYIYNADANGRKIEATRALLARRLDGPSKSSSDSVETSAPAKGDGTTPVEEPFVTRIGYTSFDITCGRADGDVTHARVVSARYNRKRVVLRAERDGRGVDTTCIVTGVTENLSPGGEAQFVFSFAVVPPTGPYVHVDINPITLAASASITLDMDDIFSNASSYALGAIDPSSNASATAQYTASTKSLEISADASRTGTTNIPVTGSDASNQTYTYTLEVNV